MNKLIYAWGLLTIVGTFVCVAEAANQKPEITYQSLDQYLGDELSFTGADVYEHCSGLSDEELKQYSFEAGQLYDDETSLDDCAWAVAAEWKNDEKAGL